MPLIAEDVLVAKLESFCSVRDCEEGPSALRILHAPTGWGLVWLCWRHAEGHRQAGADLHLLPRDCGSGDQSKCGAVASHLGIFVDERGEVRVLGICPRHLSAAAS